MLKVALVWHPSHTMSTESRLDCFLWCCSTAHCSALFFPKLLRRSIFVENFFQSPFLRNWHHALLVRVISKRKSSVLLICIGFFFCQKSTMCFYSLYQYLMRGFPSHIKALYCVPFESTEVRMVVLKLALFIHCEGVNREGRPHPKKYLLSHFEILYYKIILAENLMS